MDMDAPGRGGLGRYLAAHSSERLTTQAGDVKVDESEAWSVRSATHHLHANKISIHAGADWSPHLR
ncbi:hypothetical protein GCM10023317_95090 [Actinopolymorpha pittospori]